MRTFLESPAGSHAMTLLERMQRPARVSVPGMAPSEYTALMGTVQIFQTGWMECLNTLRLLARPPKAGEQAPTGEPFDYLLPENAKKAPAHD